MTRPTFQLDSRRYLVFAVKYDGNAQEQASSRRPSHQYTLRKCIYGVVSIRGLRICILISELNNMEIYATDIGNAYLETKTQEKVCIKAGPEFGELEGNLLIVYKALYGLRSSGKQFRDYLADYLNSLGFSQSLAEPQIFMRLNEQAQLWEYLVLKMQR